MSLSVSVQQAAANAFATWLAAQLTDVVVEPRWPSPDKRKPPKSITLVMAGRRRDTPIELRLLSATNVATTQTRAVWQVATCTQPFQLDIWALSDVDRDDIIARLDQSLHCGDSALSDLTFPMPVGNGVAVQLADGWDDFGTIADFNFEEPDLLDTPDAVGRGLYRASYRGDANFILTVTTLTARQSVINFAQRIAETDSPSDFP